MYVLDSIVNSRLLLVVTVAGGPGDAVLVTVLEVLPVRGLQTDSSVCVNVCSEMEHINTCVSSLTVN